MTIPIRVRGVGANIALTFSIIVRNFPKLALLSLLFGLPALVFSLLAWQAPEAWSIDLGEYLDLGPRMPMPMDVSAILGGLVSILLYPLFIGSLIGIVSGSYTGEVVTIGRSLRLAVRRFLPLAIFSILSNLIIFAAILPLLLISVTMACFAILAVPAAILIFALFTTMFYVGSPAVVAENLGPVAALRRSSFLTKGSRMNILGFAFLMWLLAVVINMAIMTPVMIASGIQGALGGGGMPASLPSWILGWVASSIVALLNVVAPVIMYFQMRAKRENFQLTSVADLVDRITQKRVGGDHGGE